MTTTADINRRLWESRDIVDEYDHRTKVQEVEKLIFEAHRDQLLGKRILDVGCGAGRTTVMLRQYSQHCVGLDYSEGMVAAARRTCPDVTIVHGDMRDMRMFVDRSFDVVLCAFNGLDYVSPEDRLKTLGEMRRVLDHGGLLVFSSHNLHYESAKQPPRFDFSPCPLRLARNTLEYAVESFHHLRNHGRQVFADGYAVVNDCAHRYALLSYYIDKTKQEEQLRQTGFRLIEMVDKFGKALTADSDDRSSSYIYYVALKA